MTKFISRKMLEIRHSNSYQMRGRLKQMGCEWDAIARAWIAPTMEVKELLEEELEAYGRESSEVRSRYLGQCGFNISIEELEAFERGLDPSHGALPEEAKPIAHTPTKEEAIKICGEENVRRYWHEFLPEEAAAILASGEKDETAIQERLSEQGWKGRQISLLIDVVDHFRQHPPIPALDEKLDSEKIISQPSVNPEEMQGSLGIVSDSEGVPQLIVIQFPWSQRMVARVKTGNLGQKWNATKKRWEVPIKYAGDMFRRFPHFSRSLKAEEIEKQIL